MAGFNPDLTPVLTVGEKQRRELAAQQAAAAAARAAASADYDARGAAMAADARNVAAQSVRNGAYAPAEKPAPVGLAVPVPVPVPAPAPPPAVVATDKEPVSPGQTAASTVASVGKPAPAPAVAVPPAAPAVPVAAPPTAPAYQPPLVNLGSPATAVAGAPAAVPPANNITKTVDGDGRKTYSGVNIGAGATINGDTAGGGFATSQRGFGGGSALGDGSTGQAAPAALGFQPQMQAPVIANSTNDYASALALKNAETAASSIANRQPWGMRTKAYAGAQSPSMLAYEAALKNDAALQQANAGMQGRALDANAGLLRTGMTEAGATTRTGIQDAGATTRTGMTEAGTATRAAASNALGFQRNQIDAAKTNSDITRAGFDIRAAQQQEQLRAAMADPQATAAQRAQAAATLRAMSGKEDGADWGVQVTPATKNADGSTTEASIYRYNKRTGDVNEVGGAGAGRAAAPMPDSASKLQAGKTYQTARGPAIWDGKQFKPA